jgi:hypothetical protein
MLEFQEYRAATVNFEANMEGASDSMRKQYASIIHNLDASGNLRTSHIEQIMADGNDALLKKQGLSGMLSRAYGKVASLFKKDTVDTRLENALALYATSSGVTSAVVEEYTPQQETVQSGDYKITITSYVQDGRSPTIVERATDYAARTTETITDVVDNVVELGAAHARNAGHELVADAQYGRSGARIGVAAAALALIGVGALSIPTYTHTMEKKHGITPVAQETVVAEQADHVAMTSVAADGSVVAYGPISGFDEMEPREQLVEVKLSGTRGSDSSSGTFVVESAAYDIPLPGADGLSDDLETVEVATRYGLVEVPLIQITPSPVGGSEYIDDPRSIAVGYLKPKDPMLDYIDADGVLGRQLIASYARLGESTFEAVASQIIQCDGPGEALAFLAADYDAKFVFGAPFTNDQVARALWFECGNDPEPLALDIFNYERRQPEQTHIQHVIRAMPDLPDALLEKQGGNFGEADFHNGSELIAEEHVFDPCSPVYTNGLAIPDWETPTQCLGSVIASR